MFDFIFSNAFQLLSFVTVLVGGAMALLIIRAFWRAKRLLNSEPPSIDWGEHPRIPEREKR